VWYCRLTQVDGAPVALSGQRLGVVEDLDFESLEARTVGCRSSAANGWWNERLTKALDQLEGHIGSAPKSIWRLLSGSYFPAGITLQSQKNLLLSL
jgi:hypothetical protein